jgi:CBS domain-containing protein
MELIKSEKDWFESEMKVKEAMTRMPFTVAPEVSIFDARKIMRGFRVRHLPVLDRGQVAGIVSDRDIRTAETFHGPGYLTVRDAMTTTPYVVDPETPLDDVLREMIDRKIGSALVKSPRGVVIGIFTTYDALHLLRSLILLGSRGREDAEFHDTQPAAREAA